MTNRKRAGILSVATAALLGVMLFVVTAQAETPPAPIGDGTPVSGDGIVPTEWTGNPACADLGYDFGFKIDDPPNGTFALDAWNSVTISNSDGTSFDWSSTLGLDAVIVKGGTNSNVYTYDPEDTADTGLASPLNDARNQAALSHIDFCYDYEVDVAKTADTSYTRTYDWTIAKTPDGEYELFAGDEVVHRYTVGVEKTGSTDSAWAVTGTITIDNDTPFDATIESVADVVSGFGVVDVDCAVTFPYTLASGGSLECVYGSGLPDGSNRTNTATVTTTGVVGGGEATADVDFSKATVTPVNEEINVTDTNGEAWGPLSGNTSFSYTRTFACDADEGQHVNTAEITETKQQATATVDLDCYDLTVTKDAKVTEYSREYFWSIDKTPNATYDLFTGDAVKHRYTIEVTRNDVAAESALVSGTITVSNAGNPIPAEITGVADVITGSGLTDIEPTADCGVTFPYTIAAGGTLECTYSAIVNSSGYDLNTATATLQNYKVYGEGFTTPPADEKNGTTDYSGEADVVFTDVPFEVVPVNVVDDYGTPGDADDLDFGPFTASASVTYDRTFACDDDEGTTVNTATITETGQSDTATVVVNCYALDVTKDADTSYTRTWTWTIDKSADQTALLLSEGQRFLVNYEVKVDASFVPSAWAVAGTIEVDNPAPIDATINGVADLVSPDIAAAVDCAVTFPYTLGAGETLTCTYDTSLPNGENRTNTATATLQNYLYTGAGFEAADPATNGTTDFDGSADVDFSTATTTEIDECADVQDSEVGYLGTVCADQAPATFTYSLWFGAHPDADVVLECGENRYPNIASVTSQERLITVTDDWTVTALVACDTGCSLTPGYWKTHSSYGPAPYDDTWAQIGEDTPFFLSGQSYYEVLWTNPQGGNAYYILAHAYIAAELNFLNGSDPSAAQAAFDEAAVLFQTYTPDEVAALKGKNGKEMRAQFVELAGILDAYNNGLIGPGHCSE